MSEIFRKPKKKAEISKKKLNVLMGIGADPCKYKPHPSLVSNTMVGIEIELENMRGFDYSGNFSDYWNVVEDNSLRDNGLEYVLSRPFAGEDLITALNLFDKNISQNGKRIRTSPRTSVHVHIDVRDLSYEQLVRFVCLYATFEEALFRVSDPEGIRKNGIFATSLSNAEGGISSLGRSGTNPKKDEAQSYIHRFSKYSACNLLTVGTYGSLEFRNHEGTYDTGRILNWVNILLSLRKEATDNTRDIEGIFGDISNNGAEEVFKEIFGEYSDSMMYPDLEFDMFNGLRLAQDIIHSANLYNGVDVPKPDDLKNTPFSKYYKIKKPKRFKERINSFLESSEIYGASSGLFRGIYGGLGRGIPPRAVGELNAQRVHRHLTGRMEEGERIDFAVLEGHEDVVFNITAGD